MSADYGDFGCRGTGAIPEDPNAPDGEYPGRWYYKPMMSRRSLNWVSGTKCPRCKTTAQYEVMHPVNPCPRCGFQRVKELPIRWIPDTDTWWPWWTRWSKGHWEER